MLAGVSQYFVPDRETVEAEFRGPAQGRVAVAQNDEAFARCRRCGRDQTGDLLVRLNRRPGSR